ncbi:MAG: hypothetical protein H0U59_06850, partial [Gemmatimonadaceae bacterium]|nr:hypothetical protein [Gemmatimonadaceae bacterium]
MTRQERIRFLLEHLEDVRSGVRDRGGESGEHLPLMCRAWNSASYQELERLLPALRREQPRLAWHVVKTFFAPRRQVLQCPRCRGVMPSWSSVNFHKHNHTNVAVVPRVLRMVPGEVQGEIVERGIGWLDEHWRGDVY